MANFNTSVYDRRKKEKKKTDALRKASSARKKKAAADKELSRQKREDKKSKMSLLGIDEKKRQSLKIAKENAEKQKHKSGVASIKARRAFK